MSVISHQSSSWHRLRQHFLPDDLAVDDFATTAVVIVIAMAIAAAWYLPPALMK